MPVAMCNEVVTRFSSQKAKHGDVTASGDVTSVRDDGCRTEAHKWSGLAGFIFAIQACVMIIWESSQAQLVVHNPVLWSLHHIAPPRYPFILKMPAHLAAAFPMPLGSD